MKKAIFAAILAIGFISSAFADRCWNEPIPGTIYTYPKCIK